MSSVIPSPFSRLATASESGLMSAAHYSKLDALMSAAAADARFAALEADQHDPVTLSGSNPAGWLSLASQVLSLALVSASNTVAGVVDLAAQSFTGVKTFLSAIVAAAGVQTASVFNTNGTGSTDVGVKVGVITADGSVHASAKLLSIGTGIGGTFVESMSFLKGGTLSGVGGSLTINNTAGSRLTWGQNGLTLLAGSGEFATVGQTVMRSTGTGTDQIKLYSAAASQRATVIGTSAAAPAGDTQLAAFASSANSTPSVKAHVTAGGEFESDVAGAGVVLQSPNGTRWRITVDNSGGLGVAAA